MTHCNKKVGNSVVAMYNTETILSFLPLYIKCTQKIILQLILLTTVAALIDLPCVSDKDHADADVLIVCCTYGNKLDVWGC